MAAHGRFDGPDGLPLLAQEGIRGSTPPPPLLPPSSCLPEARPMTAVRSVAGRGGGGLLDAEEAPSAVDAPFDRAVPLFFSTFG